MTSRFEHLEQELYDAASARPRDAARYAAALEQAVQACRTDPQAAKLFDLGDGRKYKKCCGTTSSVTES